MTSCRETGVSNAPSCRRWGLSNPSSKARTAHSTASSPVVSSTKSRQLPGILLRRVILPLLATLSENAENYAMSDGTTFPQSELGPDRKAMNHQFST